MANSVDIELARQVTEWIQDQARSINVSVTVYPEGIDHNSNWLNVPVAIDFDGNAYDRATLLQQIEDAWNPVEHDNQQLLLVPAKRDQTKANLYEQVGELIKRQHQILDQVDHNGYKQQDIERFQAIRDQWNETLRLMEDLYPALKA